MSARFFSNRNRNPQGWHALDPQQYGFYNGGQPQRNQFAESVYWGFKSVLDSNNLVVICGLGTSAYLTSPEFGKIVAPSMLDLWSILSRNIGENFSLLKTKANFSLEKEGQDIERLLAKVESYLEINPGDNATRAAFESAARAIVEACDFLGDEQTDLMAHREFLRRISHGRNVSHKGRAKIFTTNYDRCFEVAVGQSTLHLIDGFGYAEPRIFDHHLFDYDWQSRQGFSPGMLLNGVIALYKLHGSVDWEESGERIIKRRHPRKTKLLFPGASKVATALTAYPFNRLHDFLRTSISVNPTGLMIIGFGFRDPNVTNAILTALEDNPNMPVLIVDKKIGDKNSNGIIAKVYKMIEDGNPSAALLETGFEEMVKFMPFSGEAPYPG